MKKKQSYFKELILLVFMLPTFLGIQAQNQKITLPQKQMTVLAAFEEIERQTDLTVAYNESTIDVNRNITVDVIDKSFPEAMNAILKNTHTTFRLQGKQIIIVAAPETVPGRRYSGTVIDDKSEAVIGASIAIKGSTTGTATDVNGRFSINAPVGSTLLVSYIGFTSKELKLGNSQELQIIISEDNKLLDEVVVVGYGTQRKRDVTTSIVSIKASEIHDLAVSNIEQAIVGRLAGVQITQPNGTPGAGFAIKVRGVGTITAGSDPLYVIDGVPLSDDVGNATSVTVSPLASLDVSDIESIEVLKDASAAAIYGSRGSNGVVIVTTKKGAEGKPVVTYNGHVGVQTVTRKMDLLNAYEYSDLVFEGHNTVYYEQLRLAGKTDLYDPWATNEQRWAILRTGAININQAWMIPPEVLPYVNGEKGLTDTDWQDAIFRTGFVQKHNLSVSGGSTNVKYLISGNYQSEKGVVIESDFSKMGFRTKLDMDYGKWKLGGNINVTRDVYNLVNTEGRYSGEGVVSCAIVYSPTYPIYDADGNFDYQHRNLLYGNSQFNNPVAIATLTEDKMTAIQMLAIGYVGYEFFKDLNFKTQGSWNYNNYVRDYYKPAALPDGTNKMPPSIPTAESRTKNKYTWVWENTLDYKKEIGNHRINALTGWTVQKYLGNFNRVRATDLPMNDLLHTIPSNSIANYWDSGKDEWALLSALGRVRYNYSEKYMLSAAIRADGSSRFGKNNRWGYFPSVSGAWYITEEELMKTSSEWLNKLKLRASWGLTGNMSIGNYASLGVVDGDNYIFGNATAIGMKEASFGNPDLGWEKNSQVDLGLEIGLLKCLNLEVDVYKGTTSDMLLNVPVMKVSGFSSVLQNIGKLSNKGIELTLSTSHKIGKLIWINSLNYSANRNKILSLGDSDEMQQTANDVGFITKVGEPIGNYYTYVIDGVYKNQAEIDADVANGIIVPNARPGDFRFKKFGEDETINADDKTITGNYLPDFTYGYSTSLKYNGFDFALSLQGVYGNEIANIHRRYTANMEGNHNNTKLALQRWHSESNPGNGSVYRANRSATGMNAQTSSWHIEDGSYMRIREITLGYTIPKSLLSRIGVGNLRVYVSAFNPFTFTKYTGFNPEVSLNSDNRLQGIDYGTYPLAKNIVLGLNFNF
ncbi:MAG: TonB-dependent receptor [Tannerella sp.]|nr:TonB-dependent receptor [Tannerella sp.]